MPRKKDSNANNRQLENQVAVLKKQLDACRKEIASSQAKHAQALKQAADIGYEMGCIEAEERELNRAKIVAEAIARFEQKHAKQVGRGSVLERAAKKTVVAKKSVKKVKVKAKAKKAAAKPSKAVSKPAAEIVRKKRPAKPVQPASQDVEVVETVVPVQEVSEVI